MLDFSTDAFGSMNSMSSMGSSMSSMTNLSPGMSGLDISGMGMANTITGVPGSDSPMMMPGNESLLFQGAYPAQQPQHQPQPPPTRPASGSTSRSATSSAPGAGFSDPLTDPSLVEPHVRYYFDSVMPMQYVFASEKAQGVLQNLFAQEPFGGLVNASCALAAKHNKTVRVARLLDPPDANPLQSTSQQFYDRAFWQLANASARASTLGASTSASNTVYTVADALASLHLVAYFLLQGGSGDWSTHLDLAREWFVQTGLCAPGNETPRKTLAMMNEAEQLAAKLTIWYDIFAAISLYQAPRFLSLYRRLLGGTISREAGSQTLQGASMDLLMGCPDDVLLVLAETAALAQWKAHERQQGTLSNHELFQRGVAIEERLLVSSIAEGAERLLSIAGSAAHNAHMHPTRPSGEHSGPSPATASAQLGQVHAVGSVVDATGATGASLAPSATPAFASASPMLPTNIGLVAAVPTPTPSSLFTRDRNSPAGNQPGDLYKRTAQVFLHTAALFLASVINDPSPGISEINNAVAAVVNALSNLPAMVVDRALMLPLALAGCLADVPEHRQFILARLSALDDVVGNVRSVRLLVEQVQIVRDMQGGVVDWRSVMREHLGVEILLV
ncbi:fungal-specific transcription factor domain-containing protein [Phellopilus nigrolimitatus]|nr:fungal-specific transcription factor domain-containing protein [Phellopilus nigrolimitatus]